MMNRREFMIGSAAGMGMVAVSSGFLTSCAHPQAVVQSPRQVAGGYFKSGFGVDEDLIRRVLNAAMEKGGDFADVFFQHRVSDYVGFEDGQVNRAYAQVDLGCGIRVLKGEQTGFAFTEELTEESLLKAARTAGSIADAPRGRTVPEGPFAGVEMP